jgi:hypothetical protein
MKQPVVYDESYSKSKLGWSLNNYVRKSIADCDTSRPRTRPIFRYGLVSKDASPSSLLFESDKPQTSWSKTLREIPSNYFRVSRYATRSKLGCQMRSQSSIHGHAAAAEAYSTTTVEAKKKSSCNYL